jgi:capsular exopolysaccharide synthesis family protein
MLFGVGAAFFRDYVDDRLRGTSDVERQIAAPVLGAIPKFDSGRKRDRRHGDLQAGEEDLVVLRHPHAGATEAFRTLRTNLMFMAAAGPLRKLLVTSPLQGEGKSTTAGNLAVVLAQAGQRVLLVDGDLRRPTVHRLFGMPNGSGLSGVLSGQASIEEAVGNPGVPGLRILPAGPIPPNPVELLTSPAMRELFAQIADVTDWLLIDAPPVLGLADASVLSSLTDGVLVVVKGSTGRRELAHARDQLLKVNARVVGAALNAFGHAAIASYAERYRYEQPSREENGDRPERRKRRERRNERAKAKAEAKADADVSTAGSPPEPPSGTVPAETGVAGEAQAGEKTPKAPPDEFFLQ